MSSHLRVPASACALLACALACTARTPESAPALSCDRADAGLRCCEARNAEARSWWRYASTYRRLGMITETDPGRRRGLDGRG